jgi:hypothetical protein
MTGFERKSNVNCERPYSLPSDVHPLLDSLDPFSIS